MKITLIIPTYNAGSLWPNVLDAIKQQTIYPDKLIVIDSGSKDETVPLASDLKNISIFNIDSKDFNHGGTRNLAVAKTLDADVIIFLTQDAILADSDAIKNLVYYFSDPLIAAVCGRQLPHKDANPLAVHARNFNYSSKSIVKSKADIEKLGIKTVFMSNSFAAYRRSVFEELRGDILGLLCSLALDAEAVAIPVSCNSIISSGRFFKHVKLTKIGSPYVIEAFNELSRSYSRIVGFEANGGFLLGSDICINEQNLHALPTRDAVLPAIMLLYKSRNTSISALVNELPTRYTHSDRLQGITTDKSQSLISMGRENLSNLLSYIGLENEGAISTDMTDGMRITLRDGCIVHLRASGNAPELRCYAEANLLNRAQDLVNTTLANIKKRCLL